MAILTTLVAIRIIPEFTGCTKIHDIPKGVMGSHTLSHCHNSSEDFRVLPYLV